MKIAAIQMVSGPRVADNLARARRLLEQAAAAGAELAVLPEYFGFIGDDAPKLGVAEAWGDGPMQGFLAQAARELGLWLVGGSLPLRTAVPGRATNTSLVFDPSGRVHARYDKLHLFRFDDGERRYDEAALLDAGAQAVCFDLPSRDGHRWRVGLSICYDLRFPELYRAYAAAGCELFTAPSAFTALPGAARGFVSATLDDDGLGRATFDGASADLVLINEEDFRAFFTYPAGHYTDIALSVANPREVRNVANKLANALPDSRPILREEVQRTYASVFDWREGLMLALLSAAILAFAILAWEKASGLSAEEKREIGILKAIGWETGDVIKMKLWEGGLISVTAFLAGFVAAYVQVFRLGARLFELVLKGWAVLYPRFDLVPVIDGLQLATLFFFTVFPYMAAVLVPIWRAAVTDPDAVMRA
jgi:predicted amidohydrolase